MDIDVEQDLAYYGLQANPFGPGTDAKVVWLGDRYRQALAALTTGVLEDRGVLLLTGDVGTGKTMLANALIDRLGDRVLVARVPYPSLEPQELLSVVAGACGLYPAPASREALFRLPGGLLDRTSAEHRRVLVVLDEAQNVSRELLEEIRQLAEIARETGGRLNILLVGQLELSDILAQPGNAPLRERVAVRWTLEPLTESEVASYIQYRLGAAGVQVALFTPEAVHEVWAASRGIPRLVNMVCELALVTGCRRDAETIGADIVQGSVPRLGLGSDGRRRTASRRRSAQSRRAARGTNGRPAKRAVAYAAVLAASVLLGGYLLYFEGGQKRPGPTPGTSPSAVVNGVMATPAGDALGVEPKPTGGSELAAGTVEPVLPAVPPPVPVEPGNLAGPTGPRAAAAETREPAALARPGPAPARASKAPVPAGRPSGAVRAGRPEPEPATTGTIEYAVVAPPPPAPPLPPPVGSASRQSASEEPRVPLSGGEVSRASRGAEAPPTEQARPVPARQGDAARPAAEAPDPSVIIDWLLREYSPNRN